MKGKDQESSAMKSGQGMCFGCGRKNPFGLRLKFKRDGRGVRTEHTPGEYYQSWPDIIHGGIIVTMLDEAMGHATLMSGNFGFLTASIQVNLKRPAYVNDRLIISAEVGKNNGRTIEVAGKMSLPDGTLVADGRAVQVILEGNRLEAVIWDMDGVIADTAPFHFQAWQEVFGKRKVPYSREVFQRNFGKRNDIIVRSIVGEGYPENEIEAILVEKEGLFRAKAAGNIQPIPGALGLIDELKEYGVKVALATSSPIENGQFVTRQLGIEDSFDVTVWGREVTEGKPSPQIFLLAAERLKVDPGNCVVIEDAVAGVAAAKRAGMKCLAVTNSHPGEKLGEADRVVDSLEYVSVADLAAIFYSPEKG
ncbi:MAG: beta-phosphoglucomutase family hydrolase [Chloroflexota bacterium]|nr:beta-phosphoglucomutase family hydrolase [Chloroflexota bacterium]